MIHELKKLEEFKIEIDGKETTLFAIPGKDNRGTLQISDEEDNPEGKTFFELLRELGEWKPENESVTTEAEAAFIERHFGLHKRNVMDLKNLRDMTVCYYTTIMEHEKSNSYALLTMMSITAVIDKHIQK